VKNLEITLALVILGSALFISAETNEKSFYQVNSVETVDGDTIDVKGEINATVRLVGVDTPEVSGENSPREFNLSDTENNRKCLRKWGEEASSFTENFTSSEEVTLITDSLAGKRGSYGRLLAYVETDSGQLGRKLLKKGYARVYESEFRQLQRYRDIQGTAREQSRGLWGCS